ncbi:hypothetical protein G7046_g8083 [Stylonectria norvegica]|nr:hypothetical protein G7046_g8083 [Stylonectria norvegica]
MEAPDPDGCQVTLHALISFSRTSPASPSPARPPLLQLQFARLRQQRQHLRLPPSSPPEPSSNHVVHHCRYITIAIGHLDWTPMAKGRRIKRRKAARLQPPNSQTSTMSSEDSYALPSRRQSSDGTLSEHATSDGVHTAMTSIMDTDEEGLTNDLEIDDDDEGLDMISIYPASHYPRVASPHGSQMPFSTSDPSGPNSDIAASTRSLWAQDLDYRDIHGRRYCREYFMPNDDIEQLRLSLQHQVFDHVLGGELSLAPIEDPTHILDVGTGTGEWAIKMAEMYPHCEVVGTDISAIAETRSVPMNVFFEIEDAEDWDRLPDQYDLIHLRCMEGAFQNWRFIYDSVFYSTKPGGWIEIQDLDSAGGFEKFLSVFPPGSPMHTINTDLGIAAGKAGRPRGPVHLDPELLMEAGFVDVGTTEYVIPITVAEKSAGKIWLISCLDALEASCLRLLTEYMGWDPEECKAACETAARQMANFAKDSEKSQGLQIRLQVITARKPLDAPQSDAPPSPYEAGDSPNTELVVDERSPDPTLCAGDDGPLMPDAYEREINGIEESTSTVTDAAKDYNGACFMPSPDDTIRDINNGTDPLPTPREVNELSPISSLNGSIRKAEVF